MEDHAGDLGCNHLGIAAIGSGLHGALASHHLGLGRHALGSLDGQALRDQEVPGITPGDLDYVPGTTEPFDVGTK